MFWLGFAKLRWDVIFTEEEGILQVKRVAFRNLNEKPGSLETAGCSYDNFQSLKE